MKMFVFLLAMASFTIGCGNPHEAGVATGTDEPEVHTEDFEKGEKAQQNQRQE